VEAFSRTADAFNATLGLLSGGQWAAPALRDLDVQRLVGHLIGVEQDVHRCLAGDPEVFAASHVESTQPAADRQDGQPPALTRADWRRAVDRTIDLVRAADLSAETAMYGLRLPVGLLLTGRVFELWVHENDIRKAVALPPSVPEVATLNVMTSTAVRLLPQAAAQVHVNDPVRVHLVLTGPGGGTWDFAVGQNPAAPAAASSAVTIVADAVGFCRLAGNRITAADLDPYVAGDRDRAAAVLATASMLALD
jgi:uncharacterized protein (TIGR03083 family)